jgi:hypothetical protein
LQDFDTVGACCKNNERKVDVMITVGAEAGRCGEQDGASEEPDAWRGTALTALKF